MTTTASSHITAQAEEQALQQTLQQSRAQTHSDYYSLDKTSVLNSLFSLGFFLLIAIAGAYLLIQNHNLSQKIHILSLDVSNKVSIQQVNALLEKQKAEIMALDARGSADLLARQ